MSENTQSKEIRYVGVKENLAYGFANAGQVFGYNLVAAGYLSLFFTKVFGIPEKAVATMILVLGLWDTINDPLMGGIIDKTRTRYGKLRPYLLIVPIPLAIATIMLFAGPEILADAKTTTVKIIYMYISYFVWEFFYTIGDVPFWGMSTAISPSPADRTRAISSARFISSILGGLATPILVVMMDLSNNGVWGLTLSQDFLFLAIVAAVMILGLFSLAGRKTKERVVQSIKEPSVLEGFKVMLKNKPLMLIIIGNVIGALAGLAGVFQTYYYSEVLNLNSAVLWINLPGTIFGFLTYLLIPKVKKKFDNKQIVMINLICRFVVGTLVFVCGLKFYNSNILVISILLMIQNFIFSFFNTINMVIPTEMIGDTVDYMEWKTGERNEGVSFSVLTFVGKLTGSLSTSLGTALLPIIGLSFTTNSAGEQITVKGDHTDLYVWALFTCIPYLLGLLSIIPYLFYDLTGEKLEKIRADMKIRRENLSKEVSGGAANEE
ncbi:MAG: glycoside-pentoside-hexuronide (GPH):cation symporter [Eubacterium sp.]|nr:glycoside-pentoside-hexuronide (GPH):cation symporter [Eubacterium sp.]